MMIACASFRTSVIAEVPFFAGRSARIPQSSVLSNLPVENIKGTESMPESEI
jgi:hypothetical protein